jgi:hypothetical protein
MPTPNNEPKDAQRGQIHGLGMVFPTLIITRPHQLLRIRVLHAGTGE